MLQRGGYTRTDDSMFLPADTISNPRQRRKIVGSFHNPDIITQPDVLVSKQQIKTFLKDLARKEIIDKRTLEQKFQQLIAKIHGNIAKIKLFPMFDKIRSHKHLAGILAYFTLDSLYRRYEINPFDLLEFLKKFPDPYIFQNPAKGFLDMIALFNPARKRREYEKAMKTFMELVYGKQFEYLIQINLLRREAKKVYSKNLPQCKKELESLVIETIAENKSAEILNRTKIHGSPFKGQFLTPLILKMAGLQPRFRMTLRGRERALFSPVYDIGQGRIAVVAYFKKGRKYIAGSYYLSNSHAVWRYLDGYFIMEGRIISYGKKRKQDSMNLAYVFQKALSEIMNHSPVITSNGWDSDFIFAGTTVNVLWQIDAAAAKTGIEPEYALQVPQKLSGNFYPETGKRIPPGAMKFYNLNQAPDFSKSITTWETESKTYGKITYEAFLSGNGQFIYTFCQDEKGRIWLGSIENHSSIKSTGIREIWVDGGDLITPAYEYFNKAGNYGNADLRWGNYIDMFKNYLSKIWKSIN